MIPKTRIGQIPKIARFRKKYPVYSRWNVVPDKFQVLRTFEVEYEWSTEHLEYYLKKLQTHLVP